MIAATTLHKGVSGAEEWGEGDGLEEEGVERRSEGECEEG